MMNNCGKNGFYLCQRDVFQGSNRGEFLIPIEMQKLDITKKDFQKFVDEYYSNSLEASFFKLSADLKINTSKPFNLAPYRNITHMQILNEEGSLVRVDFKEVDSIVLINTEATYKLGVLPEDHNRFISSKRVNNVKILRLNNNILRYHMEEAKLLGYDKSTLDSKISHALAPIIAKIEPEIPEAIKIFIKKDLNEVARFYMPLENKTAISQKLQKERQDDC